MTTGLLLGVTVLYYLVRPISDSRQSLYLVTWLLSLNWVAQLSATLYPGTLPVDPEFGTGFPQAYICAILFTCIAIGHTLERMRMARADSHNIPPKSA